MAQLKDLLVTGAARFLGDIYGNLKGTADRAIADENGRPLNNIAYAICDTIANTQDKEISIPNFTLSPGATIRVKFTYNNSAASPNLVVNGTSKAIKLYGSGAAAGASDTTSGWRAGAIVPFTYDGTQWIRDYWENTIYTGIPSGGSAGNLLLWKSNGTAQWGTINYAGSNSIGGAANSANKLNTDAGSDSQPVYFKNGIPVACKSLGLTTIIETVTVENAGKRYPIPSNISTYINDDCDLSVYHNGILLTRNTHYTIVQPGSVFLVLTYTYNAGDIFTFKLTPKYITSIDLSGYLTTETANSLYMPKSGDAKSFLATSGGTMTGSINMGQQNIINADEIRGNKVYGAVWNDYAEYRIADTIEPGIVVCENGDDTMSISKERMQPGAAIVSDTFGFAIGETDKAKTPIAVSGRVLAKPYEPIEDFKKAIGRPVCAGPNGTVSIMTDEEYATKGYCAIGTISAVPNYTAWGDGIKVNNRVWIKVG